MASANFGAISLVMGNSIQKMSIFCTKVDKIKSRTQEAGQKNDISERGSKG